MHWFSKIKSLLIGVCLMSMVSVSTYATNNGYSNIDSFIAFHTVGHNTIKAYQSIGFIFDDDVAFEMTPEYLTLQNQIALIAFTDIRQDIDEAVLPAAKHIANSIYYYGSGGVGFDAGISLRLIAKMQSRFDDVFLKQDCSNCHTPVTDKYG